MKSRLLFLFGCAALLVLAGNARAQTIGDVIGVHDMTTGSKSPVTGARAGSCQYCHALESNAFRPNLYSLQQHNLRTNREPPASTRQRQQPVLELS